MTDIRKSSKGYINLKEASALSGYAPDYIGQLIRSGRLPGKQLFCNVAWVTTEEAITHYVELKKGNKTTDVRMLHQPFLEHVLITARKARLWLTTHGIKALVTLSILSISSFALLLFYIFSVNLDRTLTERAVATFQATEQLDATETSGVDKNYIWIPKK